MIFETLLTGRFMPRHANVLKQTVSLSLNLATVSSLKRGCSN